MDTQSVITRTTTVAGGRYAPGHLGELTQLVPFEMVDAALTETAIMQSRVRDLPSRVVVYLLLAAYLFPRSRIPGCLAQTHLYASELVAAVLTCGLGWAVGLGQDRGLCLFVSCI